MRILAALFLALSACVFYVPLDEEDAAVNPDAAIPAPDAADWPDWDTTSCATPAVCPPASPGKVSVCGRIYEVGDQNASLGNQPDIWCGGPTPSGACSLRLDFFPALPFASNPTGTPPMIAQEMRVDGCGRFYAYNLDEPELGYMAVGIDDADPNQDDRVLTWAAMPATSGGSYRIEAYTQTRELDDQWSAAAGLAEPSFGTRGALLLIFEDQNGNPVPGVTITENGTAEPQNDYYFSDTDPDTRLTIDPARATTGANGAVVKLLSSLVNHSGSGGEPSNCSWVSSLAASVQGTLYVARYGCE